MVHLKILPYTQTYDIKDMQNSMYFVWIIIECGAPNPTPKPNCNMNLSILMLNSNP